MVWDVLEKGMFFDAELMRLASEAGEQVKQQTAIILHNDLFQEMLEKQ